MIMIIITIIIISRGALYEQLVQLVRLQGSPKRICTKWAKKDSQIEHFAMAMVGDDAPNTRTSADLR